MPDSNKNDPAIQLAIIDLISKAGINLAPILIAANPKTRQDLTKENV